MLYVFIVSTGCMVKFDMNLAVKKVIELKFEIEKLLCIPVDDQVLLCSGGEELKSENIVGNYSGAGTDTNPIFLFSKFSNEIESVHKIAASSFDLSIEDDVSNCSTMAPSSNTAAVRVTLAQRFADIAVSGRRSCDELVHSQHLQQQGWAAVVANLDDAKEALIKRKHHFEELYEKYLANRPHYEEIIKTFSADVELLSQVPLLPKLMIGVESDASEEHTLLSWFCSEPLDVLQSLTEKYLRSLEELNHHTLAHLNEEINVVLKKTDNPDIKEVKGIEERLASLNKQIEEARKIEKEQRDLAAWFSSTQTRISRDPAVLPDLCGTFQDQLLLMLGNHKCLKQILDRCTRAKEELAQNIDYRIKYICRVESEMYDLQVKMVFLEKHVLSVMKQYSNFKQVHLAPERYFKLLAECCRRKTFSSLFMKWASELSSEAFQLYEKEVSVRRSFMEEDSQNMVDNLFPGLHDMPPPFATECPQPFDQKLPDITKEDLDPLRIRFSNFSHLFEVPASDPMPQVLTDSVFSSSVPMSKAKGDLDATESKILCKKGVCSPCKLSAPSGDCSEYASLPNEVFSLASSPFEDPLLPSSELDLAFNCTRVLSSEVSSTQKAASSLVHDVDAEEFESLDCFAVSPEANEGVLVRKKSSSALTFRTSSEVGRRPNKARSEGDAVSPVTDQLRRTESGDFQSAEYYIDDSMPSSYTESGAMSPLLRGSKTVKSHHVVVSELQKQIEEKASDCDRAQSLVETLGSSRMKLCTQMSALQKLLQELRNNLQLEVTSLREDLTGLQESVKGDLWSQMAHLTKTADAINQAMLLIQKLVVANNEELEGQKNKNKLLVTNYVQQLEIEAQKLNDAETQIHNYEQHISQMDKHFEEIKHENKQLKSDVDFKQDCIKSMMLEHELELDSLRNRMKQNIESRDDKICELTQAFNEAKHQVQSLEKVRLELEKELERQRQEKESTALTLENKEAEFSERLKDLKQLQDEIRRLQDGKTDEELQNLKAAQEKCKTEFISMKKQMEEEKSSALAELEKTLKAVHQSEMESLRSQYESASPQHPRLSSASELPLSAEVEIPEISQMWIPEKMQKLEVVKEECIRFLIEGYQDILLGSIAEGFDAVQELEESSEKRSEGKKKKEECVRELLETQLAILKQAVVDAVSEESVKRDAELASLIQEHEESIEKMKSRQIAQVQVSFNEAIKSVTKEKELMIESLRSRVSDLESNLITIKLFMDKYASMHPTADSTLPQSDTGASSSQLMSESKSFQKLKSDIEPYLQVLSQGQSLSCDEKILLEKMKSQPKHKSLLCTDCKFKVSILSCDVGDLILLCYEEKHESFVVFHFGPFVHFLHTDSLQPLGLKIPADLSERWALGVVVSKEFCVTRKPCNRYKINLGAKFYRVKVKPWDKDKAIHDYQLQRMHRPNKDTLLAMSGSSI